MTRGPISLAFAAAMMANAGRAKFLGVDLASGPDETAYWPRKPAPSGPTPKRAKVKAARKQRSGKP